MMGTSIDVVPVLGKNFNQLFPIGVAVLCILNLLNIYSRVIQVCGLGSLEFEWAPDRPEHEDTVLEGQQLVERERRRQGEGQLLELQRRSSPDQAIPLRMQINALIE